jgi:hypothetical protein
MRTIAALIRCSSAPPPSSSTSTSAGSYNHRRSPVRAAAAQAAVREMVLVCNDPAAADLVLERWRPAPNAKLARRAAAMEGTAAVEALCPVRPEREGFRDGAKTLLSLSGVEQP